MKIIPSEIATSVYEECVSRQPVRAAAAAEKAILQRPVAAQQRSLFIKHFLLKAAEQVFRPRASTHTSIN
jgi:hypothetical protein